jgi:ABC-type taurine transport system ATPase subunit
MTEVMSVAKEIEFALMLTPMVLMNHPNPAKNLAARESNKAQRLAGSKTCGP